MESVLKFLINSLENGNILIAFVVIAVALIFKAHAILDFLEKIRESKNKSVNEIAKNENLSEDVKSIVLEKLNALSFQSATGIYVENPFREQLIILYKKSDGKISLYQLKTAINYIKYEDRKIKIEIGKFDTVSFWLTNIGSLFLFLFSLLLFFLPAVSKATTISQLFSIYSLGIIFCGFSFLMFKSSLPVISAKRIKPFVENNESEETPTK